MECSQSTAMTPSLSSSSSTDTRVSLADPLTPLNDSDGDHNHNPSDASFDSIPSLPPAYLPSDDVSSEIAQLDKCFASIEARYKEGHLDVFDFPGIYSEAALIAFTEKQDGKFHFLYVQDEANPAKYSLAFTGDPSHEHQAVAGDLQRVITSGLRKEFSKIVAADRTLADTNEGDIESAAYYDLCVGFGNSPMLRWKAPADARNFIHKMHATDTSRSSPRLGAQLAEHDQPKEIKVAKEPDDCWGSHGGYSTSDNFVIAEIAYLNETPLRFVNELQLAVANTNSANATLAIGVKIEDRELADPDDPYITFAVHQRGDIMRLYPCGFGSSIAPFKPVKEFPDYPHTTSASDQTPAKDPNPAMQKVVSDNPDLYNICTESQVELPLGKVLFSDLKYPFSEATLDALKALTVTLDLAQLRYWILHRFHGIRAAGRRVQTSAKRSMEEDGEANDGVTKCRKLIS